MRRNSHFGDQEFTILFGGDLEADR